MALGNKETMAENIRYYMDKKGIDRQTLVANLGLKYMTVSDWINAKTYPRIDKIELLANYFGVKKSDLVEEYRPMKKTDTTPANDVLTLDRSLNAENHSNWIDYGKVLLDEQNKESTEVREEPAEYDSDKIITFPPKYDYDFYDSAVSAGTGQYLGDVQKETISLPIDVDADFVIPVDGRSMEPEYYTGDYVFVKLSVDLKDGNIGVFDYYGDAYIKQLVIDEDGAYLHSFNPEYPDMPIDADTDFRIIGEVVDVYREG